MQGLYSKTRGKSLRSFSRSWKTPILCSKSWLIAVLYLFVGIQFDVIHVLAGLQVVILFHGVPSMIAFASAFPLPGRAAMAFRLAVLRSIIASASNATSPILSSLQREERAQTELI